MSRVTSSLKNVVSQGPPPKNVYELRCSKVLETIAKTSHNPMLEFEWTIQKGDYKDRVIKYDNVVTGGISQKTGEAIIPFGIANLIEATEISWECSECGEDSPRDFIRSDGSDGLRKGQLICPSCGKPTNATYESNDFLGKVILAGVEPDENNKYASIKSYLKKDATV